MKLGFVGAAAAAELVHPFGGLRWAVGPFLALAVEEVNIPGRSAFDQAFGKRLSREMGWERIIKMLHALIFNGSGYSARGRFVVVETGHLNPDDADADVRIWKVLQH